MKTSFHKHTYLGKLHYFTDLILFWLFWDTYPLPTIIPMRENSEVVIITQTYIYIYNYIYMEVSQNGGTPKSSIYRWTIHYIHFNRIFLYKPSIWGHHHLWQPPYLFNAWWNDTSSRSSQGASFFLGRWGKKHEGFRCIHIYICMYSIV